MSTSIAIKLTNRGEKYKEATNNIPVNGRQQSVAAAFGGFFPDAKVVVNVIEVTEPGKAAGVNIMAGPLEGPYKVVKTDGTPLKVKDDGKELDISNWILVAGK
ncbi:MAG: hypothetical protein Q9160_008202 [Pyrenula sp. 1 TL-2023]